MLVDEEIRVLALGDGWVFEMCGIAMMCECASGAKTLDT